MIRIEMKPSRGVANTTSIVKAESSHVTIGCVCDISGCCEKIILCKGPMRIDHIASVTHTDGLRATLSPHGWEVFAVAGGKIVCRSCVEKFNRDGSVGDL